MLKEPRFACGHGSNYRDCLKVDTCPSDSCACTSMLVPFQNKRAVQLFDVKDICIDTFSTADIESMFDAHFKIQKLIGRGRKGCVYELLQNRNKETLRYAGKIFADSSGCYKPVTAEARLAEWAYNRRLAPRVVDVLHKEMQLNEGLQTTRIGMLVMEKMDMPLSRVMERSYSLACRSWKMAFALLTTGDLSSDAQAGNVCKSVGWLCCDDMKPDNILLNASKDAVEPSAIVLTDWDPEHWHSLPLSPEDGQFLNRLLLCINTVLCHCQNKQWLMAAINCWPDHETGVLRALAHLSELRDMQLLKFLKAYSKIFNKGPFYYAGVRSVNKKTRAQEFAQIFHSSCTYCIARVDEQVTARAAQSLRTQLRKLRVQYLRRSIIRRSTTALHEGADNLVF